MSKRCPKDVPDIRTSLLLLLSIVLFGRSPTPRSKTNCHRRHTRARSCHRGRKDDPFCTFHVLVVCANARSNAQNWIHEIAHINLSLRMFIIAFSHENGCANKLDHRAAFLPRLSKIAGTNTLFLFRFILISSLESIHLENMHYEKFILNFAFDSLREIAFVSITNH